MLNINLTQNIQINNKYIKLTLGYVQKFNTKILRRTDFNTSKNVFIIYIVNNSLYLTLFKNLSIFLYVLSKDKIINRTHSVYLFEETWIKEQ